MMFVYIGGLKFWGSFFNRSTSWDSSRCSVDWRYFFQCGYLSRTASILATTAARLTGKGLRLMSHIDKFYLIPAGYTNCR